MLCMLLGTCQKNICNLEYIQQRMTKMFWDFKFCYRMTEVVEIVPDGVKIINYSGEGGGVVNLKSLSLDSESLRRGINIIYLGSEGKTRGSGWNDRQTLTLC